MAEEPAEHDTDEATEAGAESTDEKAGPSPDDIAGWKKHRLDELGGAAVGKVEGSFVDEKSGQPEWLLARMGRFGHYSLVPARDAVAANERVWVPYTRDQIRAAPRVEPKKPLQRDDERALLEHYGVGTSDSGRGADLDKLDPDAITARPA